MANLGAMKRVIADKSTLVDAGGTPLWHPPASLQEESSLRSTLSHTEPDSPRNDISSALGGTLSCMGQAQESASSSPVYTYTSFTPINKRSAPHLNNTPNIDHEPPICVLRTTSETFRQHYGRHIPEIKIDMYEVGEHELDSLEQDERRVYHIGLNKGGSYSGRLQQQPLKPELEQMISKTLGDNVRKKAEVSRRKNGAAAENLLRTLLSTGWKLFLERTPAQLSMGYDVKCSLPGCLAHTESLPPARFYVSCQPTVDEMLYGEEECCFCLDCLEWL